MGAAPAGGALRAGDLGAGQPRAADLPRRPAAAARRAALPAPGRALPARSACSPRRTRSRSGTGPAGPVLLAPLFLLYDYSFGRNVGATKEEALRRAHEAGVVCVDEYLLHPDPYPEPRGLVRAPGWRRPSSGWRRRPGRCRRSWSTTCRWSREPTRVLRHPEFAQWCGTDLTADWHRRFRAHGRRLRPPAHSAHHLARRRALRGGLARLPARARALAATGASRSRGRSCRRPRVLEQILPPPVAVVAETGRTASAELFPEEEAALGNAVEKRRREFVTARACAREALAQLGLPAQPIPTGARGEPLWPRRGRRQHHPLRRLPGLRGRAGERAARRSASTPRPTTPLPDGVLGDIALPEERRWIAGRARRPIPASSWDRLLFSIKESVYKAWFPLTRTLARLRGRQRHDRPRAGHLRRPPARPGTRRSTGASSAASTAAGSPPTGWCSARSRFPRSRTIRFLGLRGTPELRCFCWHL